MMTNYAIVENGVVTNIPKWDGSTPWTPPAGATLVTVPSGETVAIGYTYAGGVFSAPTVVAPVATAAEIAAAAYAALISGGITITSTGTPALNGVYPIDAQSQVDISTEALFISTFAEFTNGTTTGLTWMLQSGAAVSFPSTASFMAFAKATAQLVAAAKLALAQSAAMPSPSATIP